MNPVERWRDDISERLDTYGDRRETFGEMQALRDAASVVRSSPIPPEVAELVEVVRLLMGGLHLVTPGRAPGSPIAKTLDMASTALAKWEGKGDG